MSCKDYDNLYEALTDFDQVSDVVLCPYTSEAGMGMGMAMFGLLVASMLGMGLTIRTQHPAPVLVSAILSAGLIAQALPGGAARILALILFFGISGVGLWVYSKTRTQL
jgi:hypothetical protein